MGKYVKSSTIDCEVYIAAPFFNAWEREKVGRMECILSDCGIPYFSPMRQNADPARLRDDETYRKEINDKNLHAIKNARCIVAWVDRLIDPSRTIAMVDKTTLTKITDVGALNSSLPSTGTYGKVLRQDLIKPDDGVLWEMGYASALDKHVIIFTSRQPESLNLMLVANADGYLVGLPHFTIWAEKFLEDGPFNEHLHYDIDLDEVE